MNTIIQYVLIKERQGNTGKDSSPVLKEDSLGRSVRREFHCILSIMSVCAFMNDQLAVVKTVRFGRYSDSQCNKANFQEQH